MIQPKPSPAFQLYKKLSDRINRAIVDKANERNRQYHEGALDACVDLIEEFYKIYPEAQKWGEEEE